MDAASKGIQELLHLHDAQLRGRIPPRLAPIGSVVDQDGPVVRTHYGTHGTVDHREFTGVDFADLIRRQQCAFAQRHEPVEWKIYSHDAGAPQLIRELREAGFTPGWERSVLVIGVPDLPDPVPARSGHKLRHLGRGHGERLAREQIRDLAALTGPHRRPFTEVEADGRLLHREVNIPLLERDGRVVSAGWAEFVDGTEFVALGGMTGPHAEFLSMWASWAKNGPSRYLGWQPPDIRFIVAEADGALRRELLDAGFLGLTSVRSYHGAPPTTPARDRPVRMLFDDPEHDDVRDRFEERFTFKPGISVFPGVVEPPESITWHLAAITDDPDDSTLEELQAVIKRGLRACTSPGEVVYALDWQHQGYRFDPHRVGGPGRPRRPGSAYPDGDYHLYVTRDVRLGTFGHPWEDSLCVFGDGLPAEVESRLTALLGTVLRRGGRNVGNIWTFGPE
ncbi:DUF2716 domain-containing protein [Embleya sp. AB8]|uniref:DUF2716 domain-containing protein n=1 Tax=Embleya sp. AB8 TaxID=3156304 RepID=UPI003C754FF5